MKVLIQFSAILVLICMAFTINDKPITLHLTYTEGARLWQGLQDSKIILAHSEIPAYRASLIADTLSQLQEKIGKQITEQK